MQTQCITRRCARCGKPFTPTPSNVRLGNGNYCTRSCARRSRTKTVAELFWPKVLKTESCWLWTGMRTPRGYGHLGIGSVANGSARNEIASRVSWLVHFGNIPEGKHVLHNCPDGDNPACVNPAHLWLGTHQENVADCIAKDRNNRGERAGPAKLTDEQAREILHRFRSGETNHTHLAREFGIGRKTVAALVQRRTWRHLT